MNKPTVRQHFVPKTYLKYFATEMTDKYFVSALFEDKEEIIDLNIDNVALEKHLYTTETHVGEKNQKIEDFYAKIEANYNGLYAKLNDPNIIYFTDEEKQNLIIFIVSLYLRTPINHRNIAEYYDTMIERIAPLSNNKKVMVNDELILDFENKPIEQIKREFKLISKFEFNLESLSELMTFSKLRYDNSILIAELTENEFFITSDNPVIVPNNKNTNDHNICLPINSKKIIILLPPNGNSMVNPLLVPKIKLKKEESVESERLYNGLQLDNSIRTLIGNKEALVKSVNQMKEFDRLMNSNYCRYKINPAPNSTYPKGGYSSS